MSKWAATTDHAFLKLPDNVLHRYNLHDSYWTAKLLPTLINQLQQPKHGSQWQWFKEVIQPLQLAVMDMQARGVPVDRKARSQFVRETTRELAQTDSAIRRAATEVGFKFTDKFPNSSQQVGKLLFGPCGLKPLKRTKGGAASVDQDALLRVLKTLRKKDEPHRQLLYDLCHRSRLQTMLERYTRFEIDADSRVRPSVKMAATKTWRFAYADPALQQFPPETRGFFRASPGKLLVTSDYSQLEARWLALLSGDTPSLSDFALGIDIHAANARDLLAYSEADWGLLEGSVRKASRGFAKGFLYRISYGGEGSTDKSKTFCPCPQCEDKVPQTLTLKRQEILAAEARWFAKHIAVRRFHEELISSVKRKRYYETPFGVRRFFARTWGPEFERELKNAPMQTCSALLMNQRQVRLHQMGAPIILQHHDSFTLEVPEKPGRMVDQWEADLKGVMEEPCPEVGGYSFPAESSRGYTWASLG